MKLKYLAPLALALVAGNASAIVITTETIQLPTAPASTGMTFQTDYTLVNGPNDIPVEAFSIFFEAGLFENLMVASSPLDWDSFVLEPDPGIPDDGFFDTLSFAGPIAPGQTLGGFSVSYDFLGSGTPPGPQTFTINDPDTFETVASGTTGDPAAVPEPATLALLGVGLFGLSVGRRRTRRGKALRRSEVA